MDRGTKDYAKTLKIGHFDPDKVPWRRLGQYLYRILEDGSQTQMRLCVIESLLPPQSAGPVFHWHECHDEGFYVTKGTVRFHTPGYPPIDAKAGHLITVPIRLPHKFSNPFDEEAVFINTITPGFFVRYFEYLEELIGDGEVLTKDVNMAALRRFATLPLDDQMLETFEKEIADANSRNTEAVGNSSQDESGGSKVKVMAQDATSTNGHASANELVDSRTKTAVGA